MAKGSVEVRFAAYEDSGARGPGKCGGAVSSGLGIAEELSGTPVVPGCEVRDIPALGRLFSAGIWQRVVSAHDVRSGQRRVPASPCDVWHAGQVWIQGFHPEVQGRALRSGGLGEVVQGIWREIRRSGIRASRR